MASAVAGELRIHVTGPQVRSTLVLGAPSLEEEMAETSIGSFTETPSAEQVMLRHLRFVLRHRSDQVVAVAHFYGEARFGDAMLAALTPYRNWLVAINTELQPDVDDFIPGKATIEVDDQRYFGKRLEVHQLEIVDGEPVCVHSGDPSSPSSLSRTDMCLL